MEQSARFYVVDTNNLDKFRTHIDEFWQHQ